LAPIKSIINAPEWTFVGKMVHSLGSTFRPILNPNPAKIAPQMQPTIERGEYLAHNVANCVWCHTPRDPITFEAIGPEFSGGNEIEPIPEFNKLMGVDPDLWTRAPNITPYVGGALSKFTTIDEWIQRWESGRQVKNSPMQWGHFSRMTQSDVKSKYPDGPMRIIFNMLISLSPFLMKVHPCDFG
jgi:hypothetical protein